MKICRSARLWQIRSEEERGKGSFLGKVPAGAAPNYCLLSSSCTSTTRLQPSTDDCKLCLSSISVITEIDDVQVDAFDDVVAMLSVRYEPSNAGTEKGKARLSIGK